MKRKLGTADSLELANYLGKLLLVKTKGNDEIRAYRIRDFINSRLNGEKIVDVAKKTETNPRNMGNWLGNTKRDIGFPLSKLLIVSKIYNIRNRDLFGAIKIFGCTNSKKSRLPKRITPRLAYLLGYLMGDGHLANPKDTISNGSEYNAEVKITTSDIDHIRYLQNIFYENFSYRPPIFKDKGCYKMIGRSKVIHRFLHKVCEFPVGNKKEKTAIPNIVKGNLALKQSFVSGFFDSDGTVYFYKGKLRSLRIKQYNKKILVECNEILKESGIVRAGIYVDTGIRKGKRTKSYVLAIQTQREIGLFIKEFFSLKIQERARKWMKK